MFRNYLKTAVRNLLKSKTYSLLNISGLTIGFASCLVILLYVPFSRLRQHSQIQLIR